MSSGEESLWQVNRLIGLRPGDDRLEVIIFTSLELAFAPLRIALSATLLLV